VRDWVDLPRWCALSLSRTLTPPSHSQLLTETSHTHPVTHPAASGAAITEANRPLMSQRPSGTSLAYLAAAFACGLLAMKLH
jgi:hypothetical protein